MQTNDSGAEDGRPATFNVQTFLDHLDHLFATKQASELAEPFLLKSLEQTRGLNDHGAELTVLNELMGFYRSHSDHEKALDATRQALDLVRALDIDGTAPATTTLINAATAYRAAHRYDEALSLYREALDASVETLTSNDRKLAALHNNLSIAYSDLGRYDEAQQELDTALEILISSSPDPSTDIDVGSTHANLALVCSRNGQKDEAEAHIEKAMRIFAKGGNEDVSHYSSALAAAGEAFFHAGKFSESIDTYKRALDLIARSYGTDNDYYSITSQNLEEVVAAAEEHTPQVTSTHPRITGLELSRRFWNDVGAPLIAEKYERVRGRIAAGLVGHGSEAYGFDDEFSRDHDFTPRFCLWLTAADNAEFGAQLQRDYDALPQEYLGFARSGPQVQRTPRSQGSAKRDGVFSIPDFYESITGLTSAPGGDESHAVHWLMIDEATFAAATNGQVFSDSLGEFSRERAQFKAMPDDVRLSLISRRLGMMSQAGQYNFPRMIARLNTATETNAGTGAGAAAWRSLNEFIHAAASLVFLVNDPSAVGYLPYYKWEMAALKKISARMGTRLAGVADHLEHIMENASAACLPLKHSELSTRELGGYDVPHAPAADAIYQDIAAISALVVRDLRAEKLTTSTETFLEWQRPYVEEAIANPQLKSL
jgi:tetratricopeptide (TPR) repeat protein